MERLPDAPGLEVQLDCTLKDFEAACTLTPDCRFARPCRRSQLLNIQDNLQIRQTVDVLESTSLRFGQP